MSDQPQGPGWWIATDGKFYPPQSYQSQPPPPPPTKKKKLSKGMWALIIVGGLIVLGAIGNAVNPSASSNPNEAPATYCDAIGKFQGTIAGLQNSTLTDSEAVSQLAGEENELAGASTIAPAAQQPIYDLSVAIGHLKVAIDSGSDINPALDEVKAALLAVPKC